MSPLSPSFKFTFNPCDDHEHTADATFCPRTGEAREDFRERHASPVFEQTRLDTYFTVKRIGKNAISTRTKRSLPLIVPYCIR